MNDDLETAGDDDATPDAVDAMAKEAQRIEEDSWYSSKSHFETSVRWDSVHLAVTGSWCCPTIGGEFCMSM